MAHRHSPLWWGPPENFENRRKVRKVSWLELFYDLVYVAAIDQLTQHLASNRDWGTMAFSFLLFSLVFWSWVNGSQYYDLHGSDGIRTRVLTFIQMLCVAAVAVTLVPALEGHHRPFAVAFATLQGMITYLWWSVGFFDPSHRQYSKFYTFNYLIALGLLVISLFTGPRVSTYLWVLVLLLDLTPQLTGARTIVEGLKKRGQVFTASETIVERFGLFTIIVLAESIMSAVTGTENVMGKLAAWIAFILAMMISFLIWSIYFDMTSEQETKSGYTYMQWLVYLHFPLLAALGVVGACIKVLLSDLGSGNSRVQWMFSVALAVILFSVVALTRIMKEEEEDRSYISPVSGLLVGAGLVVLLIPLFGPWLNSTGFLSLVALVLLVPVLIGVRSWVRYKFFSTK
jgi:low temperature requirement protein LtrA